MGYFEVVPILSSNNSRKKKPASFGSTLSVCLELYIHVHFLIWGYCLPKLCLIFTGKISQLMEQLDVFISIKPKPKQPSKVRIP